MPTIDPDMSALLARMKAAPVIDYRAMPIAEARRLSDTAGMAWDDGTPAVATRELTIVSGGHAMRARLHLPVATPAPLVLFVHGGGWTFGSIDTHGGAMRVLAAEHGCAVLGMDYRLAPEHPFPTPLDDVMAALVFAESGGLGEDVDTSRMALAGDSAGANLALAALLRRRDEGGKELRGAALFYGCFAPDFDTPSNTRCGTDYMLTTQMMRWYWRNFLGQQGFDTTSLAAPSRATLAGLPPLYLASAGLDPLADDTFILARRLGEAGCRFVHDHEPGVVHGYLRMARELAAGRRTLEAAGRFLAEGLDV